MKIKSVIFIGLLGLSVGASASSSQWSCQDQGQTQSGDPFIIGETFDPSFIFMCGDDGNSYDDGDSGDGGDRDLPQVPIPAAGYLFLSALAGMAAVARRRRK